MNNIYILQNEIENLVNKVSSEVNATDDEKIIALQLALATAYKVKNTRNAYMTKIMNGEEKADGNKDA